MTEIEDLRADVARLRAEMDEMSRLLGIQMGTFALRDKSHPLFNPSAGPGRFGDPPPRYPTRAECIAALRAGVDAAIERLAREPDAKPQHIGNSAALCAIDVRPPPDAAGVVRQSEMVMLANWLSGQLRGPATDAIRSLLDDFVALVTAAPLPEE